MFCYSTVKVLASSGICLPCPDLPSDSAVLCTVCLSVCLPSLIRFEGSLYPWIRAVNEDWLRYSTAPSFGGLRNSVVFGPESDVFRREIGFYDETLSIRHLFWDSGIWF